MLDLARKCSDLIGPGHRLRWVVVLLLALLAAGLEVLGALLVVWLLAGITTEASAFDLPLLGDLRDVLPGWDETVLAVVVGGSIAGVFLLRGVVIVGQAYVQYRVAENAGARLATRLLEGYLAMPNTFHLQRNSAELVRNTYDIVQQFVREALVPAVKLLSHSLIIVGLVAVLLVTSPVATLLVIAVLGPLVWALLRLVQPRVKRLGQVSQAMSKTTLQTLSESLAGWRDITLLGNQPFFVQRFAEDRRSLSRTRYLRSTAKEVPRVALESCLVLAILSVLGVSLLTEGGALDALPTLGLFGYAAVRLQPSLNEVLAALNALKFVSPGIDLLHADLRLFPPPRTSGSPSVEPVPLREELCVEDVSVRYPGAHRNSLTDVRLTVRAGEFLGIVGPTGGGKSTLVDVMLGLIEPASGRVTVDGRDIASSAAGWHTSLGVVHQVVHLSDTTLRGNIALGVPAHEVDETRVAEAVTLAQLDGFVSSLPEGLDTVIGERGVKVSGGQRQRLAIARALYRRPSVIFFDEGTSALDSQTESQLMAALSALRNDRTIIAVAHRLSTVQDCDRVALVDDGRLVDVAPFPELVQRNGRLLGAPG
ncbi:ABC transporter ATP-binding protein [Modestobacter sp. VKM Ac-2985]|uniref:ABC transporter ATP-binding protein n=1 Tax=Modestobacter sp. VKM Ac-2985 TaxID=3004139 RepID=UPI0022ABC4FE|nr:ABC transporter ATP-binding protein [Modestobacter sp. VKM Ac-2985]MCZ2837710.1 ABC transporter ATP-binding protein [Modestobacter sp. VKM Ac-2985]